MALATRFEEITDLSSLAMRWHALERDAADHSFFLRWTWTGSWLDTLSATQIALPRLFVIEDGQGDAGLALIGEGKASRRLGHVPALWLNEAGHPDGDRPFIEYNGILCRAGRDAACAHAFCEALATRKDWRALHLSGLEFGSPLIDVPDVHRTLIRNAVPAFYIDLQRVREADGDYLSFLSANTRNQIRRSLKDEPGSITVEAAPDPVAADHWLDAMQCLNRGHHADSAWDSPFFRDFVRRIIAAGLTDASVELLRFTSGGETLGYLLNFLWDGRAMNYQSAFVEARTARTKPGLMCHASAVARYAEAGLSRYSLLAGKDRYKRSLSTGAEELNWWTLERSDWRLNAEAFLKKMLRR